MLRGSLPGEPAEGLSFALPSFLSFSVDQMIKKGDRGLLCVVGRDSVDESWDEMSLDHSVVILRLWGSY